MLEGFLTDAYPHFSLDHFYSNQKQQPTVATNNPHPGSLMDVLVDANAGGGDQLTSLSLASYEPSTDSFSSPSVPSQADLSTPLPKNDSSTTIPDESDDLSSEIGLLCLKAAGTGPSQYLGSSSSFSFSRMIFSSLRRVRSQGPGLTLGGIRDRNLFEMPSAVPALLPTRQIGKILANAYFDNIHPQVCLAERAVRLLTGKV